MREGNRNLRTPIEYGEVATTGQAKPRAAGAVKALGAHRMPGGLGSVRVRRVLAE